MTKYSGAFGWVITLDENSNKIIKDIALELAVNSEYIVKHPHITLYHAQMRNVPEDVINGDIKKFSNIIRRKLNLEEITPFGGKFLFWNVKNNGEIQNIHDYFVDNYCIYLQKEEKVLAQKEKLQLTKDQELNIHKYGHPLVKDLYLPHVTLGYESKGMKVKKKKDLEVMISNLMFVEMGDYGSIKKVVASTD